MSSSTDHSAAEPACSADAADSAAELDGLTLLLAKAQYMKTMLHGSHVTAEKAAEQMGLTVGQVLRLVRYGALNGYRYGAETYVEPAIVSGQLLDRLATQEVH